MVKVGDNLGLYFLNLQILSENSKPLTRPLDKREMASWKEAPYCM